jgi:hypothetical protein
LVNAGNNFVEGNPTMRRITATCVLAATVALGSLMVTGFSAASDSAGTTDIACCKN